MWRLIKWIYQKHKKIINASRFIESEGKEIFPISAATNEGLKELMIRVSKALDDYVEEPEAVAEVKRYMKIQLNRILSLNVMKSEILLL